MKHQMRVCLQQVADHDGSIYIDAFEKTFGGAWALLRQGEQKGWLKVDERKYVTLTEVGREALAKAGT